MITKIELYQYPKKDPFWYGVFMVEFWRGDRCNRFFVTEERWLDMKRIVEKLSRRVGWKRSGYYQRPDREHGDLPKHKIAVVRQSWLESLNQTCQQCGKTVKPNEAYVIVKIAGVKKWVCGECWQKQPVCCGGPVDCTSVDHDCAVFRYVHGGQNARDA